MGKVLTALCFPVRTEKISPCPEDNIKEEKKILQGNEDSIKETDGNNSEDSFYLITRCEGKLNRQT